MKGNVWYLLTLVSMLFLSACNTSKLEGSDPTSFDPNQSPGYTQAASVLPSPSNSVKPIGVIMNPDGKSSYISKEGLDIHTEPPVDGAEKVAWDWFRYRGEQKYEQALTTLEGYRTNSGLYSLYASESQEVYLKEVVGANLIRWADITEIAPKESEVEGAAHYKVVYMEMEFKVRGNLTSTQTDMHNGLNQYAVHLIQKADGDPWEIALLGGAPLLEK